MRESSLSAIFVVFLVIMFFPCGAAVAIPYFITKIIIMEVRCHSKVNSEKAFC